MSYWSAVGKVSWVALRNIFISFFNPLVFFSTFTLSWRHCSVLPHPLHPLDDSTDEHSLKAGSDSDNKMLPVLLVAARTFQKGIGPHLICHLQLHACAEVSFRHFQTEELIVLTTSFSQKCCFCAHKLRFASPKKGEL